MRRILVIALAATALMFMGCGRRSANKAAAPAGQHVHDHSGHNHAEGESCGHDHSGHDHSGHDHSGHDHSGHDHSGHDHSGHDHSGHDHSGHDHSGHDHSAKAKKSKSTVKADPHAGHDHGGGAQPVDPDEIVFPAAQAARTVFEVRLPSRGIFREVIKCGGQVTAARQELAVVAAPVAGVVTPYDGRIMASSPVKRGEKLFRLSSTGLSSGDAIAKARINYEQARANLERISSLYEDKLVTQRELLEAQSQFLTAEAEYEPVKVSDGNGGTVITSPSDGYITNMMVSAGDFVEMGQPLASIARSGRMQLTAMVSQRYFSRLGDISDANFRPASSDHYYNVSSMGGELYAAGRIVSAGSALIPVVFEFTGAGEVPDGAVVEVALLGREREGVLTLPLSAITEQQGLYYVYVQLDEECYSRREVMLGADNGIDVEILSGIADNDRVVTKGAINVKMASASGAIPHGHTH